MLISETTKRLKEQLQQEYMRSMPLGAELEPHLGGALEDTLAHPGSMVRALLAAKVAQSCGVEETRAHQLAIAIEYFHTASLLFDDLPCMDDASTRRNAPCAHRVHGEPATVLAALGLINRAYGLMWRAVAGLEAGAQQHALDYLETQLGVAGVLNGQSLDLHYGMNFQRTTTPQEIAMGKTVTLIRISLVLPAMVGGATARTIQLLDRMAIFWGLAYQTLDDLKDVLYSNAQTGKTPARDALLHRPNLALAIGVDAAFGRVHQLMRLSDRTIAKLDAQGNWGFLGAVRAQFLRETAILSELQLARAS
jgi:geranylgeranyl pyrophosphate synthase